MNNKFDIIRFKRALKNIPCAVYFKGMLSEGRYGLVIVLFFPSLSENVNSKREMP